MGEEEARLAAPGEQLVEVVGGGRPGAGVQALSEVGVVEQADVGVVDQLVFLALAQRLDGQAELVLDLVHGFAVKVGDAGVHAEHGLGDMELVLAGRLLVVGEGAGQLGLALMSRGNLDSRLAAAVTGQCAASGIPLEVRAQFRRLPAISSNACRGSASTIHAVAAVAVNFHWPWALVSACSPKWSPSARVPTTASWPYLPALILLTLPWAMRRNRSAGWPAWRCRDRRGGPASGPVPPHRPRQGQQDQRGQVRPQGRGPAPRRSA